MESARIDECLVLSATTFGISTLKKEYAKAIRTFVEGICVYQPPDWLLKNSFASRCYLNLLFQFGESSHIIAAWVLAEGD